MLSINQRSQFPIEISKYVKRHCVYEHINVCNHEYWRCTTIFFLLRSFCAFHSKPWKIPDLFSRHSPYFSAKKKTKQKNSTVMRKTDKMTRSLSPGSNFMIFTAASSPVCMFRAWKTTTAQQSVMKQISHYVTNHNLLFKTSNLIRQSTGKYSTETSVAVLPT